MSERHVQVGMTRLTMDKAGTCRCGGRIVRVANSGGVWLHWDWLKAQAQGNEAQGTGHQARPSSGIPRSEKEAQSGDAD